MREQSRSEFAGMAVLGAAMIAPDQCGEVFERLRPEMFESETLRGLYEAMLRLRAEHKPLDVVTLVAAVGKDKMPLIRQCADGTPSISAAGDYAAIVVEEWRKRTMAADLMGIVVELGEPTSAADEAALHIAGVAERQNSFLREESDASVARFAQAVEDFLARFGRREKALETGWSDLDRCRYLVPGHVVVLAARPGSGKTDFGLNVAVKCSLRVPVLYLSLEMSCDELMQRVAANGARIDNQLLQAEKLLPGQRESMEKLLRALEKQAQLKFRDRGLTLETIEGAVLREKPKLLVVDHLGLVAGGNSSQKDVERITALTHKLKQLAQAQNLCVLELVQLKRDIDRTKHGQRAAVLADLKGSGSIEEDADAVLFIVPEKHPERMEGNMFCKATLVCAKNRHGPARVLEYDWMPQYSRYIPIATEKDDFEPVETPSPFEQQKMEGGTDGKTRETKTG